MVLAMGITVGFGSSNAIAGAYGATGSSFVFFFFFFAFRV